MPTLLIAAASALLLAALVTETTQRFFADSYFALLVITFIALFVNGLFNARLRQAAPAAQSAAEPAARSGNGGRSRARSQPDEGGKGQGKKQGGDRNANRKPQERPRREQSSRQPAAAGVTPDGPTETGTVKWFNRSKGYGFIIRDNGEEIFVHQRSIQREDGDRQRPVLRDGQKVSFVVTHQDKGAQAEQVQGLD